MPYMLTMTGTGPGAAAEAARKPRTTSRSTLSPPKTTYRSAVAGAPESAYSRARWRKADGTWLSTVIRSSASSRRKSSGACAVAAGTGTAVAPVAQAPHSSQTEKSKEAEWKRVQRSSGPSSNSGRVARSSSRTLPWVTTQPLGTPVEPEV